MALLTLCQTSFENESIRVNVRPQMTAESAADAYGSPLCLVNLRPRASCLRLHFMKTCSSANGSLHYFVEVDLKPSVGRKNQLRIPQNIR